MADRLLRFFVICNPDAGQQECTAVRQAVDDTLGAPGSSYEIYEVTGAEDLRAVVVAACKEGVSCVVAAGGDGTVSAVADAMVGSEALMGILPAGTGNSLARVLGIPADVGMAASILLGNSSVAEIDALAIGERYAVLNVSAGVTAIAQSQTGPAEKRFLGRIAYGLETAKAWQEFRPTRFSLKVDGNVQTYEAMDLTVANGLSLSALSLDWGPVDRFQDGQLDAYLLSAQGPLAAGVLLTELMLGEESGIYTQHLTVKESIEVETERPVPVQVDGEVIGETPVTIRLLPRALRILVPSGGG